MSLSSPLSSFFFFNDTATTEIYTLSLHDALPISNVPRTSGPSHSKRPRPIALLPGSVCEKYRDRPRPDRKSTRLNSSHTVISYAVFCLKKKNNSSVTIGCLQDKYRQRMMT